MALTDGRMTGAPGPANPHRSRRKLYVAVAAAIGLLLAAALVVGLVVDRPSTRTEPGRNPPPSPPAPAGIVTVTNHPGTAGFLLAFHDPTTGRVTGTASATAAGVTGPGMRQRFSADLTMFAVATGDAVHVARLGSNGYAEAASWTPADLGASWKDALINPVTGRVWFRETRTAAGAGGTIAKSIRIVSIDPAVAGDKPRVEQAEDLPRTFDDTGAPTRKQVVPLADNAKASAELAVTDTRLLGATVTEGRDVQYECPAALGPDTLVCYAPPLSELQFGTPYGSVAELRFDRASRRATLRTLVPDLGSAAVQGLLVSPDGTQLRLWTERGWLSTGLPVSATPRQVEMAEPADAPLAWL